jgi:tetratricopeptide (TPR) repeat protein
MVATQATNLSKWDEKIQASAEEVYEGFRNVLDWTEGFGLVFVQCSPVQGEELIEQTKRDLPNEQVGVLQFQEGEEIRNLYDLVEQLPNREQIDVLFIKGLEYSFVPYIKSGYGGQGDYYKLDNLPPILGHLNLQRERFRRDFEICFVFLLPFFGIKYFIQRAPDFFDWRSGLFEIATEKDLLKKDTFRILQHGNIDEYNLWSFNERITKILEIETLIKEDMPPEERASLFFKRGNIWLANPSYEEAISDYNKVIFLYPENYLAWYNRGVALLNLGRYEESIVNHQESLRIKHDFCEAHYNIGVSLGMLGKEKEAIYEFDMALKIDPNYYLAWFGKGISLRILGRYEEAIQSYDQALKINPSDYLSWNNKGTILCDKLGKFQDSIAAFDRSLQINPNYFLAWHNKGFVLRKMGRLEESITFFDKALEIEPNYENSWFQKAIAFGKLNELEEAIFSFDKVIEFKPKDTGAYYGKSSIYALQSKPDLAIENLKMAISLDQKCQEMVKRDPHFEGIRNDRRFIDLINQSDYP